MADLFITGGGASGLNANGSTANLSTPTQVAGNWSAVSSQFNHALGIKDGKLFAWGENDYGQLGQGTITYTVVSTPVQIGTDTDWSFVFTGRYVSYAIKTDGRLYAWGSYGTNQPVYGDGTRGGTSSPVQITGTWKYGATHDNDTLLIDTAGAMWVCGGNQNGQLGVGNYAQRLTLTRESTAANDWVSVSTTYGSSFALKTNGSLRIAGNLINDGQNTNDFSETFVAAVTGPWNSFSCGRGDATFLGAKTNGTLWAWGVYRGNGSGSYADNATQVGSATNWLKVAAGENHYLAVNSLGEAWAWGDNTLGKLGDGTATLRLSPALVKTSTEIVNAGYYNSFFLSGGGAPPAPPAFWTSLVSSREIL